MPIFSVHGPRPTSSHAERTFYELLAAQLPDSWHAWRVCGGDNGSGGGSLLQLDAGYLWHGSYESPLVRHAGAFDDAEWKKPPVG